MDEAAGRECKRSGSRPHRALADLKRELAFEDIKRLVFALVDMRGRSGRSRRRSQLPKTVRSARVFGRRFERIGAAENGDPCSPCPGASRMISAIVIGFPPSGHNNILV